MVEKVITTKSVTQTMHLAKDFAQELKGGEVISLIGDIGAGKTTFVRGLVEAMGGKVKVKSPTFTVMNEYPVDFGPIKRVVHLDFYRFKNPSEIKALSLEDERRADTVVVAEWPNVLPAQVWRANKVITFSSGKLPDDRTLSIETQNMLPFDRS